LARLGIQQLRDAVFHFAGGLVREGHREDIPGADAFVLDQVGDAVGEGAGFAGAGTRNDQNRAIRRQNRFFLLVVESL
jgi:hypothetical protein